MKANELTSKDLMVGDWVIVKGVPTKIYDIDKIDGINREWIAGCEDGGCTCYKDIQPIPLTPEILEKNGFTLENKVKHPARYIYNASYSNSVIVDLDCYNNGRGAVTCILAGVGLVSNSFIRIYGEDIYVHELQHALRLCKVDKEKVV